MEEFQRRSPVVFRSRPLKTERRDNWTVVLEYDTEGDGPYLIDLSHRARWDIQDKDILQLHPFDVNIPDAPGQCRFENGFLINRMNRTQASLWHLKGEEPNLVAEDAYTQTTDATLFLALIGKHIFYITEKLSSLDFLDPLKKVPFLFQGPLSHVPCQLVTLGKESDRSALLFTCSRAYAKDMVAAILEAGEEFGLQPAGENVFNAWIEDSPL